MAFHKSKRAVKKCMNDMDTILLSCHFNGGRGVEKFQAPWYMQYSSRRSPGSESPWCSKPFALRPTGSSARDDDEASGLLSLTQ